VQLVDGVHHLTFLTEDLDRMLAFYVRVFDAEVTLDKTEDGLRAGPAGRAAIVARATRPQVP
jgi:catechol 2,3-dioxygenase-like lactoylglutathione lyase family enzyme